jgi:hypothetical protein
LAEQRVFVPDGAVLAVGGSSRPDVKLPVLAFLGRNFCSYFSEYLSCIREKYNFEKDPPCRLSKF